MNEDQKYLSDLTSTCEEKSTAFESRQQLRAEELEAIAKAIEIVSSGAVSGSADKHLPALVQKKTSFAQLRSVLTNDQQKVVLYFRCAPRNSTAVCWACWPLVRLRILSPR
jgi:hypothetical protein